MTPKGGEAKMATVEEIFNAVDKVESKDEVSEELNIS